MQKGPGGGGGGGGLSSTDILRTRGSSSDADVRTFLRKKLRIFWNLWCVRTDKERAWASADIFRTRRGGGVNFSRFCAECGHILRTAPKSIVNVLNQINLFMLYSLRSNALVY